MNMRNLTCLLFMAAWSAVTIQGVNAQTGPDEIDPPPTTGPMPGVLNIELLGVSGNNVQTDFQFFPVGTSGAHFSLATGQVNEIVSDPTLPGDGLWWDLDIKVTVSPNDINPSTGQPREPVMMAIDKDVFNQTRFRWTDFHMTLGMRLADGSFMESDEFDFLFFKDEPPPIEKSGAFPNPPMKDEPVAPDSLWWFADPANGFPGVLPGGPPAVFWMGIQIPPHKFIDGMAQFVLREHASIPEPATLALFASSGLSLVLMRRRTI